MVFDNKSLPNSEQALPGRQDLMPVEVFHFVNAGHNVRGPFPDGMKTAVFGLGCFWGAERKFWQLNGVYSSAVGYAAGLTPNPYYEEVCSGQTGHNEVVLVVYNPDIISYAALLTVFWESHNPTQGMQQGNDVGTQYRSGIYYADAAENSLACQMRDHYQETLTAQGFDSITTEIIALGEFYYAEAYHQQYLAKNPHGYCGLGGTGVTVDWPV